MRRGVHMCTKPRPSRPSRTGSPKSLRRPATTRSRRGCGGRRKGPGQAWRWPRMWVTSASMTGTANLPKFGADAFKVEGQDLWLVPTSEVPLTNLHREEILDADRLPLKYTAYTPCFRSEAGAAGKDTRGFIRLHQFSKVEMVKVTAAETSMEEFEKLTADAEDILRRLGLHYQVMVMCTGDMGFAQYKKYDLNAWCPGLGRYLEVSSGCAVSAI